MVMELINITAILALSQVIPLLLDYLSYLREDVLNKDVLYNVVLVMSGILIDKKGMPFSALFDFCSPVWNI